MGVEVRCIDNDVDTDVQIYIQEKRSETLSNMKVPRAQTVTQKMGRLFQGRLGAESLNESYHLG